MRAIGVTLGLLGVTTSFALGWLVAQPGISTALVGPETIDELEANASAGAIELPVGQHYKDGAKHGLFHSLDTDPVSV